MKREHGTGDMRAAKPKPQVPWLEWLAAGLGLIFALGLFGMIGWQAFNGATVPPAVTVEVEDIARIDGGYRVLFRARNGAGEAAAQVEIEGIVSGPEFKAETSRVVLDYIPGRSTRRGGLFFTRDPRSGALDVRATGFAEP
ncbi:hypothetical protein [Microvirga makkahensis]|uniref:TIGR02588 family protein n=1 Tax=Microvirga makkahensis TaxID=1128670 RepID=A0A7X3MNS7_9HYPH|nr:hypothetical protein [Microvirga makkahensis]MXQ10240.1 hypothetical protein [Microvirga makkahensis]